MAYDKVVDGTQLNGALTATADAIRDKTGASASIPWDMSAGFSAAIAAIPTGGGGTDAEDAIIERTISGPYSNSRVTKLGPYAFAYCTLLAGVDLPAVTLISSTAFYSCSRLASVSVPACSTVGVNAFAYCSALRTISLPACVNLATGAFLKCYRLVSLYLLGSSVCTLSASTAFSSTPIGGYTTTTGHLGSIFVPSSMLASYKTQPNWSFFSARFVGV